MSYKIHKTCDGLCKVCQDMSLEVYVVDDIESACYLDNNYIPMGSLSFLNNGYSHKVLNNKKPVERVENTLNLLNEDVYMKYAIEMYTDIIEEAEGISLSPKMDDTYEDELMSTFCPIEDLKG